MAIRRGYSETIQINGFYIDPIENRVHTPRPNGDGITEDIRRTAIPVEHTREKEPDAPVKTEDNGCDNCGGASCGERRLT